MVRGDRDAQAVDPRVKPATVEDWATEYLDAIIAVKVVEGVDDAIVHIERYGSHHTDAIVTADPAAAEKFLARVDLAIDRTMFDAPADGGERVRGRDRDRHGRLHARGPVGVEQLTTFNIVRAAPVSRVHDDDGRYSDAAPRSRVVNSKQARVAHCGFAPLRSRALRVTVFRLIFPASESACLAVPSIRPTRPISRLACWRC